MTSRKLRLSPAVRDALVDHAERGVPNEVCGVLVGVGADADGDSRDDRTEVLDHTPVPNVADDPRTRYELDPEAALSAIERAESAGRDVVGFYHSHPRGPPEPSPTDRARATWSGYVYCIVVPNGSAGDGGDGAIRAWRWTGEAFEPVEVTFTDD